MHNNETVQLLIDFAELPIISQLRILHNMRDIEFTGTQKARMCLKLMQRHTLNLTMRN